jgi:hypothetical protein
VPTLLRAPEGNRALVVGRQIRQQLISEECHVPGNEKLFFVIQFLQRRLGPIQLLSVFGMLYR